MIRFTARLLAATAATGTSTIRLSFEQFWVRARMNIYSQKSEGNAKPALYGGRPWRTRVGPSLGLGLGLGLG